MPSTDSKLIAGIEQIAQRLHDWQTGANRGLVAEATTVIAGGTNGLPARQRPAAGELVGRHYVQARGEPVGYCEATASFALQSISIA